MSPIDVEAREEAARRLLDDRIAAVRELSEAEQRAADAREQADARAREAADVAKQVGRDLADSFNAAVRRGWTPEELRKLGFAPPTTPARKSRARKAPAIEAARTHAGDEQQ